MRSRIAEADACIREATVHRVVLLPLATRHFAPSRRRVKACGMSNDSARQHLLELITAVREEISSGTRTEFLGPNPVGYINYGADGRMLVLTVASGRCKPAGPKATSREVEALFRSMTSYGGTYTIDGNEITQHGTSGMILSRPQALTLPQLGPAAALTTPWQQGRPYVQKSRPASPR